MVSRLSAGLLTAIAALLLAASVTTAQQPPDPTPLPVWGPNGRVAALARSGHTLFVGGEFDYVGPPTGAFVTVDADDATAVRVPSFSVGVVGDIVEDGSGGWFVSAKGVGRPTVRRIRADGSPDPSWVPPDIEANAGVELALGAGRLFIGGSMTTVNGEPRAGIAALDAATGALSAWQPILAQSFPGQGISASSLSFADGVLYFAGGFASVDGNARHGLAAVDGASGAVLAFGANAVQSSSGYRVAALDGRVYVVGRCGSVERTVCAYSPDGALLPGWVAPPDPGPDAILTNLLPTPSAVYTAGRRVVALDPSTGVPLPFTPVEFEPSGFASTLHFAAGRLYIGGTFRTANGQTRVNLAATDGVTGALTTWSPLAQGQVWALTGAGGRVAVGGSFSSVGGVARRNLVAIDLRTGQPTTGAFDAPHRVAALAVLGDVLVAGGALESGTVPTPTVTAYSIAAGVAYPWSLSSDGPVRALAASERYLFVGGGFQTIGGLPSAGLAAVDLSTARLTAWNQSRVQGVMTLRAVDGAVYAAGFLPPPLGSQGTVVAFDGRNLGSLPFTASPPLPSTLAISSGAAGILLAGIRDASTGSAWYDRQSGGIIPFGSPLPFHTSALDRCQQSIVAVGTDLVQGRGVGRIAALDATTGGITPWSLAFESHFGSFLFSVLSSADYVVVGGSFGAANGQAASNLAVFRAARAGTPRRITASAINSTVTLGWQPGPPPAATGYVVEAGTSFGASDVGRFAVGAATGASGSLGPGTYYARVRGVSPAGEGAASSEVIFTLPATATPPSTPGTLTGSVVNGVVTLVWGASAGNATGYVLDVGTASGLTNIGSLPTGHLDTAFATPAPSGVYFVRVRAVNAFGSSAATNEVQLVVP